MEVLEVLNRIVEALKEAYSNKRKDVSISLLARCLRNTWFKIQTGQEVITDAVLYGTERHHWAERHFPAELEKHGFKCMPEVRIEHEGISGYVDLLCEKGGMQYAFEFKFTSAPHARNAFLPWYRRQLKYYAAVIGAVGVLILMDFNLEQHYIEVIALSDREREEALKELKERYELIKSGKEPPPEKGPWCRSCLYKLQCLTERLV